MVELQRQANWSKTQTKLGTSTSPLLWRVARLRHEEPIRDFAHDLAFEQGLTGEQAVGPCIVAPKLPHMHWLGE
jgi:hypothetical protein